MPSCPFWLLGALLTTYRPLSHSTLSWSLSIIPAAPNLLTGYAGLEPAQNRLSRNILPGAAGAVEIF